MSKSVTFILAFVFGSLALAQAIAPQLKAKDLSILGQSSTPASPVTGYYKLYPKTSDGNLYLLNSSGVETLIGNPLTTTLTGFSATPSSTVLSSDTILGAFGKLQAEVNTHTASISANTTAINGKEPAITATNANQYFNGLKQFVDFEPKVRSASLLGLSTLSSTAVTATDSVLGAIGKLQAETDNNYSTLNSSVATKQYKIQFQDEGTNLLTPGVVDTLNFIGSTVTAAVTSGNALSVTVNAEPSFGGGLATDFFNGNKTWSDFGSTARGTALTGLSTATSSAVTATDSILVGIGKLQAEVNTNTASLTSRGDVSSNTTSTASGQIAYFADSSGKLITKNSVSSGWIKVASGTPSYFSAISLGSDVSGVLPISFGGTGNTTAASAINALLPTQTSQSGKYLTTDGTNVSWGTVAGGGGASLLAHYLMSANQAIPSASYVAANYDTVDASVTTTGGTVTHAAAGTAGWSFTANATEGVQVCIHYRWQGTTTNGNEYTFLLSKNGTTTIANGNEILDYVSATGGSNFAFGGYGCQFLSLANGDTVQVMARSGSVGLNLNGGENEIFIFKVY